METEDLYARNQLENPLEPLPGQGQHRLKMVRREGIVLRTPLQLDEPAVIRHHDVEIDLRRRVVNVVEIERRRAFADADGNRRHAVNDRILRNELLLEELLHGDLKGDHTARNRRTTRAAVRLNDITVDDNLALAQRLHISDCAQRAADQTLNLRAAAVKLELGNITAVSGIGRARQHAVFRRDPAAPGALDMRRDIFLYRCIADHLGVAHGNEHGALRMHRKIGYNLHFAHLIVAP